MDRQQPSPQDQSAQPAAQPVISHEQALEALKTIYADRQPSFYQLRDQIKQEGSGECTPQALRYFSYVKDEYNQQQYELQMLLDSVQEQAKQYRENTEKKGQKIIATSNKWKKEYERLSPEKDNLQLFIDNYTHPHLPSTKMFSCKV